MELQGCIRDVDKAKEALSRSVGAIQVAPTITVPADKGTPNLLTYLRLQAHKLETTANVDDSDSDSDGSVDSAATGGAVAR